MKNEPSHDKDTEFEKFKKFAAKVVSVPKSEIDRREAEYQKQRKEKKKRRKS